MEAGAFVTFIHINGVVNQKNEKKNPGNKPIFLALDKNN